MAMTLRLDDEDDRRLAAAAEREGRSKQDLAQDAIKRYLDRADSIRAMVEANMERHADLMDRLA
ncbi:TraY domain-containing protein [Nocardia stercoris]|uniref:Relaxosome protein TraY n=1 Tax=Nocardia stercoris TaxID=2483361 RepID=A0A3M2LDT4_9NOCA|nr:TraY domain-containing protein [Nocardia stercoris]RMI32858.1 ribbon-helix-helix protein, CopG family [Nocardia stercoris]